MYVQHIRGGAVAVAVGLALAGVNSMAANSTVTPFIFSTEAMGVSGANPVQNPVIRYDLGQTIDNGDFVRLTFTNFAVSAINGAANVVCSDGAGNVNVDFAVHDFTSNSVTLRANSRTVADATGSRCFIPQDAFRGLASQFSSAGTATFTTTAITGTGGNQFDAGTTATTIFAAASQFTAALTTALDGVVNVENNRGSFTTGTADVLAISWTNDQASRAGFDGTSTQSAKVSRYNATVNGNFSFLDDGLDGCTIADLGAGAGSLAITATSAGVAIAGGASLTSINTACSAISFNVDADTGDTTLDASTVYGATLTFSKGSNTAPAIAVGGFTVSTSVNYANVAGNSAASASYASFGAGEWTYSGFVAVVPFMPFEERFSNTVYLSNRSAQSGGAITVTAYVDGNSPCTFTLSGANSSPTANAPINIGGRIKAGIRGCTTSAQTPWATGSLRATLVITSPLPSATTELVTAYTDTAVNRTVSVPNSSTDYR